MALKVPKSNGARALQAIVAEIARLRVASVGSAFHACAAQSTNTDKDPPTVAALQVTAANATDLPTSLTLCNALIGFYRVHFADVSAHKIVDVTALPAQGAAVDLATAQTAANLLKTSHGTHVASTTVNYTADATNVIAAANASDQGTLNTLLNELKTDINAHSAGALPGFHIELTDA